MDIESESILNAQVYHPFGMLMPDRKFSSDKYRFGFNGKENDNEVKYDPNGDQIVGSQQDYGARIYDPRIGRWLSVDPLINKYPSLSPYSFVNNNPIYNIEVDGRYFTGNDANIKAIQALYSKVCGLAADGTNEEAVAFKAALEKMDASNVEFHIMNTPKKSYQVDDDGGKGGGTTFDVDKNRVVIDIFNFGKRAEHAVSAEGRLAHELEHGSQFLRGEISFNGSAPDQSLTYDRTDEEKAFQVQIMITNTELKPGEREKTDKDALEAAKPYRMILKKETTLTEQQGEAIKNATGPTKRTTIFNFKPNKRQIQEKKPILNIDEH